MLLWFFFFYVYGDHRDLHGLTHSFPTRRSSDLVEELLDEIRSVATDEHDKGDKFELLMLHAFKTDRTFRQQFTDVWRWMEFPGRSGADIGIDLEIGRAHV